MKWFVACVSPAKDEKVTERLREQGFEVFWPFTREVKSATKKRKAYEVKHSLFPGYLFVQCEIEEVWKVESVTGVVRVICTSEGDPLPVPDEEMGKLTRIALPTGEFLQGKKRKKRYKKGDRVKIAEESSPLFGFDLQVNSSSGITLDVIVLGSGMKAKVPVVSVRRS